MATHKDISQNLACPVSPLSWGCKKIQKVVTSTLSAETMSLSSTLDQLSWLKLFWAWLLDSRTKWDRPEETLKDLPLAFSSVTQKLQDIGNSIAATDCKSLYDLVTRTAPPNCSEFRTQLQARAIKNLMSEGIKLRWVHSGAQLADALTKIMEASFLRETLKRGYYKLHDELEILKQRSHNRTRLKWLRAGGDSQGDSSIDDCHLVLDEFEELLSRFSGSVNIPISGYNRSFIKCLFKMFPGLIRKHDHLHAANRGSGLARGGCGSGRFGLTIPCARGTFAVL